MKEVKKTMKSHQMKAIRSNLIGYSFILPNLIG